MSGTASASISAFPRALISLHDLQFRRGTLSAIAPYAPGFILVTLTTKKGEHQVILPAELQKKLVRLTGEYIEILKDGEHTVQRMPCS
ncbi:MAG: hypothetical protein WC291_11620 [Thermodesulfovibrionales bacterium]|jgi:hypothetical protein